MNLLKFENVFFKTHESMYDLKNINLEIKEGKFHGILGPNGSGKTSIFTLLSGLNKPTSGEIYYLDQHMSKINLDKYRAEVVGILLKYDTLLNYDTVEGNLELIPQINGKIIKQKRQIKVLEDVGLDKTYLKKTINLLTPLEKQKVVLARILIKKCKIIVAKDPTKNLDPKDVDIFLDLLLKICKEEKLTLILTTTSHHICKNFDHVYGMNKGKINFIK